MISVLRSNHSSARGILALACLALLLVAVGCSPSKKTIAFTSDRDGNLQVYSVEPDGDNETNLTDSTEEEFSPIVSPSQKLIAFQSGTGQRMSIEVMRTDGNRANAR